MREEAQSAVQIDEHNLDKECVRLPNDYLQFAHLSADVSRSVDEAKAELEVVQAELSKVVRQKPEEYGIAKVTESAISEVILTQKTYQDALQKLQRAKHKSDLASAVVRALEIKKRSLTNLVELHGMSYFSNPKVSERGRGAVEEMTRKRVRRPRREDD